MWSYIASGIGVISCVMAIVIVYYFFCRGNAVSQQLDESRLSDLSSRNLITTIDELLRSQNRPLFIIEIAFGFGEEHWAVFEECEAACPLFGRSLDHVPFGKLIDSRDRRVSASQLGKILGCPVRYYHVDETIHD